MKYLIAIITMVILSAPAFSQKLIGLNYSISFPFGDTHDYINKTSFRGVGFDGRWFISDHVSAGFSADWHTFYKNVGQISENNGTTTTTAYQYRYINDIPIMLTGHYYTGISGSQRFYAGAGIGTAWAEQRTDRGIYTNTTSNWHFAVAPEVGVLVPLGLTKVANVSAQYHYSPKSGDSMDYSYMSLKLGLLFR